MSNFLANVRAFKWDASAPLKESICALSLLPRRRRPQLSPSERHVRDGKVEEEAGTDADVVLEDAEANLFDAARVRVGRADGLPLHSDAEQARDDRRGEGTEGRKVGREGKQGGCWCLHVCECAQEGWNFFSSFAPFCLFFSGTPCFVSVSVLCARLAMLGRILLEVFALMTWFGAWELCVLSGLAARVWFVTASLCVGGVGFVSTAVWLSTREAKTTRSSGLPPAAAS